jgi:hypothetical protein
MDKSRRSSLTEEEDDEETSDDDSWEEKELESATTLSLFHRNYAPKFMDICAEFADSEEFLVDGDALLRQTLAKEGLLEQGGRHRLASLHIIALLEQVLANFRDRGGKFNILFFRCNADWWAARSNVLLLLRMATILHLQQNTKTTVFTDFEDPFDPTFQNFVKVEKPSFFLSSAQELDQDALFFLEIKNLGLNFADVFGMRRTLVSVFAWYSSVQLSKASVVGRVKVLQRMWRARQPTTWMPPPLPLPSTTPHACHLAAFTSSDQAPPETRQVLAAALLCSVLQSALPLLYRVVPGQSLAFIKPKNKKLEQAAFLLLPYLASSAHVADILDTQFLLLTLRRIAENALSSAPATSLVSLCMAEVAMAPFLLSDLQHLDTVVPQWCLLRKDLATELLA